MATDHFNFALLCSASDGIERKLSTSCGWFEVCPVGEVLVVKLMRALFLLSASGLLALMSSCQYLSLDVLDPGHAYYVNSGEKTRDRHRYESAYAVCWVMMSPEVEAKRQECEKKHTKGESCGYDLGEINVIIGLIIPCARALSGVPTGDFGNIPM